MTRNPSPVVLLAFIFIVTAVPNYDVIFDGIKCTAREDYISNLSCFIDRSDPKTPRLNLLAQLMRELPDMRVDLAMYLIRENNKTVQLFRTRLKGCTSGLDTNSTMPFMRVYANIIVKYGHWPRQCPIPKGFEYEFVGVVVDANHLPKYMPDAEAKIHITQYDDKINFFYTEIYLKLTRKNKAKKRIGSGKTFNIT